MSEKSYRIRIKVGEVEIEVEGDREFVEKHIREFKRYRLEIVRGLGEKGTISEVPNKKLELEGLSLAEFYKQKQPKDHDENVTVFAYWLTKKENREEFHVKDIRNCYKETKVPEPKNIYRNISAVVGPIRAYLVKGSRKGFYKLTRTGEEFVEGELPRQGER